MKIFEEWRKGLALALTEALSKSKAEMAQQFSAERTYAMNEISQPLGISRTTFYRYVTAD